MYEVLLRFKVIKTGLIFEAILDSRLSFKENFKILEDMLNIKLTNMYVFDAEKKIFLDEYISIEKYNIKSFMFFYLF